MCRGRRPAGFADVPQWPLDVVGVAYDESDESKQALEQATGLARLAGASVRVVSVLEADGECWAAGARHARLLVGDAARGHASACPRALDDVVAAMPGGVQAEGVLLEGIAAEELVRQDVDILFCGSRGYGLASQVLLGATSAHVVRHASCPVVVTARGVATELFTASRST